MSCLIALFGACVFDPSAVYLRGEVSTQISGSFAYQYRPEGAEKFRSVNVLIGRLELGVYVPISKTLTLRYAVEHTSMIDQADRGEERAVIGFEWKPFR